MIDLNNVTFIVPGNKRELIYETYNCIPGKSNTIIINILESSTLSETAFNRRNTIFIECSSDTVLSKINEVLKTKITTEYVIILQPNAQNITKYYIEKLLRNLLEKSIIVDQNNIGFHNLNSSCNLDDVISEKNSYLLTMSMFVLKLKLNFNFNNYGYFIGLTDKEKNELQKMSQTLKKKNEKKNLTIILPKTDITLINQIKQEKDENDELIYFNTGKSSLILKILEKIKTSSNDNVLIINPETQKIKKLIENSKKLMLENNSVLFMNVSSDVKIDPKNTSILSTKAIFEKFKLVKEFGFNLFLQEFQKMPNKFFNYSPIKEKKYLPTTKIPQNLVNNKEIFIIIPFMHNGDRWSLFEMTIKKLKAVIDQNKNIKILIHETSKNRYITQEFIDTYDLLYMFTPWNEVFHRGWSFNVAVKYLPIVDKNNTILVFMDGDILITKNWLENLKFVNSPVVGWSRLFDITKASTNKIISKSLMDETEYKYEKTRFPDLNGASGGISVIPANIFFDLKGFPEDFRGSWGGEDNALFHKFKCFGHNFTIMEGDVYHLYHEHSTIKVQSIRDKWKEIMKWTYIEWEKKIKEIENNWGVGKEITIAMINFMREKKLLNCLNSILDTHDIPLNIILQLQNYDKIPEQLKIEIEDVLKKFKSYKLIKNDGNLGVGTPRYNTTNEALKKGTEYTLILDSDMILKQNTIKRLFIEMEKRNTYGAISCWCEPFYSVWEISNKSLISRRPQIGFNETDVLGTGCVLIRTEVFKNAKFNKNLFIGYIDFLWCMDVKTNRWNLGIVADPNFKILNDKSSDTTEYRSNRHNIKEIERSRKYFLDKWGIRVN